LTLNNEPSILQGLLWGLYYRLFKGGWPRIDKTVLEQISRTSGSTMRASLGGALIGPRRRLTSGRRHCHACSWVASRKRCIFSAYLHHGAAARDIRNDELLYHVLLLFRMHPGHACSSFPKPVSRWPSKAVDPCVRGKSVN